MKLYENFEDWWLEIENYGTRGERCMESMSNFKSQTGLEANIHLWLRAAFDSARLDKDVELSNEAKD